MSRVATELGSSAMSLYRYVSAKDDLILLMQESGIGLPPLSIGEATGWRLYDPQLDKFMDPVADADDFAKANVKATQTIDIQDFVPLDQIASVYFETPYYIAPQKRAASRGRTTAGGHP